MANENKVRRGKKRRPQGVPTALMIILLVIALVMGGLAGFAIARRSDPVRQQLLQANSRILELENTLTLMGFSLDSDDPETWAADGEDGAVAEALNGDVDDDEDDDLWSEDLLAGTLDEDVDPVVVAEFDGGELLSTEVIPEYNDQLTTQILSGYSADEVAESVLNTVLSYMAGEKIIALKAKELGLDEITDADLATIEAEANEIYADQLNYFTAFVAQPGMSASEINDAAARESGITLEGIVDDLKASWPVRKFYDYTVKDVTVTDAEVQKYYKDALDTQKSSFDQSPDEYEFAHSDGELILYNPSGYRAVRDLLLPFDDDDTASKAADLLDQIDQLDPTRDAEKIQTLQAELDPLYAPLEKKAAEIVKRLQGGESFSTLLDEYGEDEGMESEPVHTEGYYISDESFLFSTEFIEGSMLLEKPGDVSSPLRSSAGVHLVEYTADVSAGEVPLDSVKDKVEAAALEEKRDEYYQEATAAMLDEANVKYYPERLQ